MSHIQLKKIRKQYELTQADMTELLGLKHKSHYNQLENGKLAMKLKTAKKIADIFNKSVDDLFFNE